MNPPRQNRAGQYMQQVLANIPGPVSRKKALKILLECSNLADQDMAECQTSQQKQAVWAALVSATQLVVRNYGGDAGACRALSDALINMSQGRPGSDSLTSRKISNTHPLSVEWIRACTIALVDAHPDLRQQTYKDAARVLDVEEASVKKMRENFKGGQHGGNVLIHLVGTARQQIEEFGHTCLKDLL